jgi:hypothetical protein
MARKGEGSFAAKDVVADPALLDLYPGAHLLLRDQSWAMRFDTLTVALDLLAPRGWQALGITFIQNTGELCALLRRVSETLPEEETWPLAE